MTRPTRFPTDQARKILDEGIPFGPRLHPCVCGEGRHAHAGPNSTGACKPTGCKRFRADQAWELAYKAYDAQQMSLGDALRAADRIEGAKRRKERPVLPGTWRIGVSDTDTCPKAIWYRNKPPADLVLAWEDKREATVGTIIHEGAEARMRLVYPWREFEQWVTVPGLDRESRFDWYDPITCEAGDTKTAGDWRWDKLAADGPDEDTWGKVQLYGLALEEMGKPVKTVRLDYLKRANGHDETFVRDYDRATAIFYRDRLVGYATALDLGLDLPRTGEGPDRDPLCKRCPFRNHCWDIPAAQAHGRSPYSWTMLGPDPEEQAISWAIQSMVEAKAEEKAAKDKVEQVKDLLGGIEPGRYGEFEGYTKPGGTAPDYKSYAERLADFYGLPEDQRPALDAIPGPAPRKYTYVQWGRVRKATLEREAKKARLAAADTAAITADTAPKAIGAAPPVVEATVDPATGDEVYPLFTETEEA